MSDTRFYGIDQHTQLRGVPWVGDLLVVTKSDHLAVVAAARAESYAEFVRRHHYDTVRADGIAEGVKAARNAIPDNDHRTDLDINDYDTATEYGLAIAKAAIDALVKP